jgi:hypothetical protein
MRRSILLILILVILSSFRLANSQTLDANIDGTVYDANGAAVSGALVAALNVDSGDTNSSYTDEAGAFRFPMVRPGRYHITVKAAGFKSFVTDVPALSAGQTSTIELTLEPGPPEEVVEVTSDAAILDTTRTAIGKQLNSRDVKNLPLVSRQVYNYVLLQPGVTGRQVSTPLAVDMSSSGLKRRVAYLLDGHNDNDPNLSGFRLNVISEVYVKEMHLLSSGYSAQFGNTAGGIVSVSTPEGTNEFHGTVSLLLRPPGLSSKPFGAGPGDTSSIGSYGWTAAVGGAVIKNRWHYYLAHEWTRRNSIVPITVKPENQIRLIEEGGVSRSIFMNDQPTSDTYPYFLARTDFVLPKSTRINIRYNTFISALRYASPGGLLTTERSFDFTGYDYAVAAQAVTTFSPRYFSEFRFQIAKNILRRVSNDLTGRGPAVNIFKGANLGPDPAIGSLSSGATTQFQGSVTRVTSRQSIKFGAGIIFLADRTTGQRASQYTFANLDTYLDAAIRGAPKSYSNYQESSGDNKVPVHAIFVNGFVQDDWQIWQRVRLAVGLRYDLYLPPAGDPQATLPISRKFLTDGNNFAARLGLTYQVREGRYGSVFRFGGGVHYDPPLLDMYRRALLNNGSSKYGTFTIIDPQRDPNAPNYPNRISSTSAPRDIDAVAPDFKTMYAVRSSFQLEQALTDNMSVTFGYALSVARHIPVYRNMNCLPTGQTLADGRPLYGTYDLLNNGFVFIHPCTNKIYPQFNLVKIAESGGNQFYNGGFVQWTNRFSHGLQFNANYTFSRSTDDAPEENGPGPMTLSDPSNRALDKSRSRSDVMSVFNLSVVAEPKFKISNVLFRSLLNNNRFSVILIANSSELFNITTNTDLNRDGVFGPDRPVGLSRFAGKMPAYLGVDARCSRLFRLSKDRILEFYIEATNIFNRKQVSGYNAPILTSGMLNAVVNPLTGVLQQPIPDYSTMQPSWRESRQVQLALRLDF